MGKVYFIDVTNRDGAQAARIETSKFQRTMINYYLGQMGVCQSEYSFPFIWHEWNYVDANIELAEKGAMGNLILEGWCRAVVGDVETALQKTKVKHLNVSISTSDQMIQGKFRGKIDHDAVIRMMEDAVHAALEGGALTVGANAEDASRTDVQYLIKFARAAKQAGACRVRYCDTLGLESPDSIYQRVFVVAQESGLDVELHCHNDLGMAVANSVSGAKAAVDGGVNAYINTTVNGVGERAGNADLLSCILAIKFARGIGDSLEIGDDLDLSQAWKLGHYVADAYGLPVPINQVGIGANAFAHESGIHADGMLKDRHNYELYEYELLGRAQWSYLPTGRVITTGEYGGLNGLRHVYEQLGITFEDPDAALQILNLVQVANAHNQIQLKPDELHFIADHPQQVHKILSLTIPDPAEHIGVRREQDLVGQTGGVGDGVPNGVVDENGNGTGSMAPWTEVTPVRKLR
ncbi:MAG: homocitrate synthase [Anaerolineae bacterium]|nr:homocitrate synthase [Anaerolineae bacterium]